MHAALEQLLDSLVWEGYALYPYTPGATKNATPTPFGIVYPPDYAESNEATFDRLRVQCVLTGPPTAQLSATVRFLQASGSGHEGSERRIELPGAAVSELEADPRTVEQSFDGANELGVRVRLRAEQLDADSHRISLCVHNTTAVQGDAASERSEALLASLISTHVVIETSAGRFISPLEREGTAGEHVAGCENVNTWPVLAAPGDDAVLGAAIFLPDHPSMAPESLGGLFDSTEIEEALLLHVQTLSEAEREQIEAADPAVREMVERAAAATPEQIMNLHGRLEEVPAGGPERPYGHPNPGERELTLGGATFRKGSKVVLRPDPGRDVYDRMLAGRTATIERIYLDYDDVAHIGVTIDDDPGQDLFRETGRYLFFKSDEVEVQT